jgi:hypothetical protein
MQMSLLKFDGSAARSVEVTQSTCRFSVCFAETGLRDYVIDLGAALPMMS